MESDGKNISIKLAQKKQALKSNANANREKIVMVLVNCIG